MRQLLGCVVVSLIAATAGAQQAPPSCSSAAHRQFDFWVGDWTVTDSARSVTYGSNQVTSEEGGCLVHEHWAGSKGGTGQSFNFFEPRTGKWEQVWVGQGGWNLHLVGAFDGRAMVLKGESLSPTGAPQLEWAEWSPHPDGRVRQFWRQSTDGGKTWVVYFDGWYAKR